MRIASAPVSFGVDEVQGDAWRPDPDEVLSAIAELGLEGTELGPPGFLGGPSVTRDRLERRGLALVGAYFPLHFGRPGSFPDDLAWLRRSLADLRERTPHGSEPKVILGDSFTDGRRLALAGVARAHPEVWLDRSGRARFVDDVHRAAEASRSAGFDAVVHPHVGTYLETDDEVRWVAERLDPALVGLCLDTGHVRLGGGDPVRIVDDFRDIVRHVHAKDVDPVVAAWVTTRRPGLRGAVERGVFAELGQGDADIGRVLARLRATGYDGWVVLEQDRLVEPDTTLASLTASVGRNLAFVRTEMGPP